MIFNREFYDSTRSPTKPAGGTVKRVVGYLPEDAVYSEDISERETPGTPGILQTIRAASAFQLQSKIGFHIIEEREQELKLKLFNAINEMNQQWQQTCKKKIEILGPQNMNNRLSVFAVQVYSAKGVVIHFLQIHRLLNDLFGIQVRSDANVQVYLVLNC